MTGLVGILGAGNNQVDLIRRVADLALPCITIDGSKNRLGHLYASSGSAIVDLHDKQRVLETCKERGVSALITTGSELGLRALAFCGHALTLPNTPPAQAVALTLDKREQRKLLKRLDVNVPEELTAENGERPGGLPHGADLLIKPSDMWGAIGATRLLAKDFTSASSWEEGVKLAADCAASASERGDYLIERFVSGDEYGVNVRVVKGQVVQLAATRKIKLFDDWVPRGSFPCCASGVSAPTRHACSWLSDLGASLALVVHEIAPTYTGLLNTDIIWDGRNLTLLEFTFRAGGNGTSAIADAYLGTEQVNQQIQDAVRGHSTVSGGFPETRHHKPLEPAPGRRPISLILPSKIAALALAQGQFSSDVTLERLYMQPHGGSRDEAVLGLSRGGCLAFLSVPEKLDFEDVCRMLEKTVYDKPGDT